MKTQFLKEKDYNKLKSVLQSYDQDQQIKSILLFLADGSGFGKQQLDQILSGIKKPLIGGIFPELIADSRRQTSGALVVGASFNLKTQTIHLDDNTYSFIADQNDLFRSDSHNGHTIFVFLDAFAQRKCKIIDALFNRFGPVVKYLGGGAGSLSFEKKPCVFTNLGVEENAAVIGMADTTISLGVAHGWEPVSLPMKVSSATGNLITSLDWQPAFDVYKKVVEQHSGQILTPGNFFGLAKSYPLGVIRFEAEMVVRDPISSDGNSLNIIDQVSEGEFIQVLHGNLQMLLSGARKAREQAEKGFQKNAASAFPFCFDCISRVLFMTDDFDKEINIAGSGKNINGVLTIGEIANSGHAALEIYNKTIVVSLFDPQQ